MRGIILLFVMGGWFSLIGCGEGNRTQFPTPINREAVVELYVAALENKDSNAILALHHPQNLPDLTALSNRLDRVGGQPIEVLELTFLNEFGAEITAVQLKGNLGTPGKPRAQFTERFTLSRQDGRWYLYIGKE